MFSRARRSGCVVDRLESRRLFAIEYTFVDLGLPSVFFGTLNPQGISGDGTVVLASASPNSGSFTAYSWTAAGGWQNRGSGALSDADADGDALVGTVNINSTSERAIRVVDGTQSSLGVFAGGTTSNAAAVSADGSTVVGTGGNASGGLEAFRWTAAGGMQSIGDLPGGDTTGIATDVNRDGSVVVGTGRVSSSNSNAFRWTAAGGLVALPGLSGAGSDAAAVNGDGSVIVGASRAGGFTDPEPVRWDAAGNVTPLGGSGVPADVSSDGSTIVGQGADAAGTEAVGIRWRGGARVDLNTITSGLPSGIRIQSAVAIAGDSGTILVRTTALGSGRVGLLQPVFASVASRVLTVAGSGGNDTITFAVSGSNVAVKLASATQSFALADFDKVEVQAGNGNDRVDLGAFNKPAYLSGGSGADTLVGGESKDTILGGGGGDRIYGRGGNDRLRGSGSRDFIYGEAGDDRVEGEDGDDYLDGGGNKDRVYGGEGNDSIIGGSSVDRLYGDDGNDSFIGGPGGDYLFGGLGTDRDRVPDANDILDSIEAAG